MLWSFYYIISVFRDLRFALCESKNLALQRRVNELEKLLTSENYISSSNNQSCFNSLITMQKANIYNQVIKLILKSVVMEISTALNANFILLCNTNNCVLVYNAFWKIEMISKSHNAIS